MERRDFVIHSSCLNKDMRIIQYGTSGVPFVGFPSQCGGAGNYEEFGIIRTLSPYLDAGRMQLFCVDSVDHESWYCEQGINTWRSARQEDYYRHITEEVLPIVQENSPSGKKPVVMGIDMGATHAAIVFFRRPELFSGMLALSGIYDSAHYYHGWMDSTLYDNSVECFLSNMPEDHPWIRKYNNCFMIFCCGRGSWEDKCRETLQNLEKILHRKRINALIDYWGSDVSHDWVWWKQQLEYFIPPLLDQHTFITEP